MSGAENMRFEFGKNWRGFVKRNFNEERCQIAKARILQFIGRDSFEGLDFLDIGCGSGLHSLAALQAKAGRIHSLDYDPNSVSATNMLREYAGNPPNWRVERGDALDQDYMAKLGKWNFVYSWGVLHHTGNMWQAIRNAQNTVADNGWFYLALYSADAQPEQQFWLDVKQRYNRSSEIGKRKMVWWYIWNYMMNKDIKKMPEVVKRAAEYRLNRGMNLFADIRDWLGGWPMEFAGDQETVDLLEELGFTLRNVSTGQACSEFLFERVGKPKERTIVKDMVAAKRAAATAS